METDISGSEKLIELILLIIVGLIAIALIVKIIFDIQEFSLDLQYINLEIRRTDGAEREHWKRKKKRLWLSAIFPFLRF